MKTDTAHHYWATEWARADGTSKWEHPEPEVMAFAAGLPAGAAVLDLGAGSGGMRWPLPGRALPYQHLMPRPKASPKSPALRRPSASRSTRGPG